MVRTYSSVGDSIHTQHHKHIQEAGIRYNLQSHTINQIYKNERESESEGE